MTTDEQLRDALEKWREGARQAQLRWVTVDTVDKDNGKMCIRDRDAENVSVVIAQDPAWAAKDEAYRTHAAVGSAL